MRNYSLTISFLFVFLSSLAGCSTTHSSIKRHYFNTWEKDIGYAAVTEANGQLFISGIACDGASMQIAVTRCYKEITDLLQKFSLTPEHIIKENIYTTDIDALIKVIPDRKLFFTQQEYPAATWVEVKRLFDPTHIIEIELIVALP